ncbi:hypothetical protein EIP91_006525 [Steccherinum ochraceum]|uniref:J domain-containing protein n=1 Tax=Steccherinum ochraceum TaxID=92696 RepID=A0A4V2MVI7_9APHY|nr:hypothetical protein EIP91_006525 [Steccherinum ochraceum]
MRPFASGFSPISTRLEVWPVQTIALPLRRVRQFTSNIHPPPSRNHPTIVHSPVTIRQSQQPVDTARGINDPGSQEQWKAELRRKVEQDLFPSIEEARRKRDERLEASDLDEEARKHIQDDFEAEMKTFTRVAEEQFRELVDAQMSKGRSKKPSTSSIQGQQDILNQIQAQQRRNSDAGGRDFTEGTLDVGDNDESVPAFSRALRSAPTGRPNRTPNHGFTGQDYFEEPASYSPPKPTQERASTSGIQIATTRHLAYRHEDPNDVDGDWQSPMLPYPEYNGGWVSRKTSMTSLSSTRTRHDSSRVNLPLAEHMPSPSRTMNFAGISPAPSPVASTRRSSNASQTASRSGLAISAPRASAPVPVPHTPTPPPGSPWAPYDSRHRDTYEDSPGPIFRGRDPRGAYDHGYFPSDLYGESSTSSLTRPVRKQPSVTDIPNRRIDTRAPAVAHPASSPISPELPRTPDSFRQGSSYTSSQLRRPESNERGIPIPTSSRPSSRPHLPPQSSPDYPKGSPGSFGNGRQHRGSFASDEIVAPFATSSPRNFTSMRRQNSSGSRRSRRSIDPHSPRDQYLRDSSAFPGGALESYREQSATDTDGSGDEDLSFDVEALYWKQQQERARHKQELLEKEEEARRRIAEAERVAEEARQRELEARRKEEEAKRKEEEARRKEEEVKRMEEEAKRKEEEIRRMAEEVRKREEADAEAKRAEETRRREEEFKKKEEELQRREEDLRRREEYAKKEAELKERELELQRREAEAERWRREKEDEDRRKAAEAAAVEEARRLARVAELVEQERRLEEDNRRLAQIAVAEEERRREKLEEEERREAARVAQALEEAEARRRSEEAERERRKEEEKRDKERRKAEAKAERLRRAELRRAEEEERQKERQKEEEQRQALAEELRRAAEDEKRIAEEEEQRKAEAEEQRKAEEEEQRKAEEEEQRKAEERERQRLADIAEQRRLAAELRRRKEEEEEQATLRMLEEERLESLQHAEEMRLAEEKRQAEVAEEKRRAEEKELERIRQQAAARDARIQAEKAKAAREQERLERARQDQERLEQDRRLAQQTQEEEDRRLAAELERKDKEDLMRREAAQRARILAEQEAHRRAQATRADETGNGRFSSASQAAQQSNPWAIPSHRQGSAASTGSTGSTASGATSSSWETTASAFSNWSNASGSTHTSQSSTASRTPSASTPTASQQARSPTSPPPSASSHTKTSAGWKKASKAYPPSSPSPRPEASTGSHSVEERAWAERQAEHARRQQEQYQRQQAEAQRARLQSEAKVLPKDTVLRIFSEDERKWAELPRLDTLFFTSFPWPMLRKPRSPEDISTEAISAYMLSPYHPKDRLEKDRLKEQIRRWHPDRFNNRYLSKVLDDEREAVRSGAANVIQALNSLLNPGNSSETD